MEASRNNKSRLTRPECRREDKDAFLRSGRAPRVMIQELNKSGGAEETAGHIWRAVLRETQPVC